MADVGWAGIPCRLRGNTRHYTDVSMSLRLSGGRNVTILIAAREEGQVLSSLESVGVGIYPFDLFHKFLARYIVFLGPSGVVYFYLLYPLSYFWRYLFIVFHIVIILWSGIFSIIKYPASVEKRM